MDTKVDGIINGTSTLPYIPLTGSDNVTGPIKIVGFNNPSENVTLGIKQEDQYSNGIQTMYNNSSFWAAGATEDEVVTHLQAPSGTNIITNHNIEINSSNKKIVLGGETDGYSPSIQLMNGTYEATLDASVNSYLQLQNTSGNGQRLYANTSSFRIGPLTGGNADLINISDTEFTYKGQNVMNNGATADNMEFYNIAVGSGIPSGFSSAELRIAGNSKLSIITVVVTMNERATASIPYNIEFPMTGWTSTGPLSAFDYSGVYANITGQNEQDLIYWTAHWPDTLNESSSGAQVLTLTFKHSMTVAHTIEFTVVTNRIIRPL